MINDQMKGIKNVIKQKSLLLESEMGGIRSSIRKTPLSFHEKRNHENFFKHKKNINLEKSLENFFSFFKKIFFTIFHTRLSQVSSELFASK